MLDMLYALSALLLCRACTTDANCAALNDSQQFQFVIWIVYKMNVNWLQLMKSKHQQLPKSTNYAHNSTGTVWPGRFKWRRIRGARFCHSTLRDNFVIKSFMENRFFIDVMAIVIAVCERVVSSHWWWLALQLLIKRSIHFGHWTIKVLLCEPPSSVLLRACQLCCSPLLLHYRTGLAEWSLGSRQLTQSLLPGSGSKCFSMDPLHPWVFFFRQSLTFASAYPWSYLLNSCTQLWPSNRWPPGSWAPL